MIWVADVEDPDSGVLIGGENKLRAHEAAGPVLVNVVGAEMPALAHIVIFGRRRACRDADGIARTSDIENPDQFKPVLLMIEHGLVEHDQKIAVGQGQAIVRAAAERRRPVPVRDQFWSRAVGDIDHDQAGVAPCAVRGVAVDDGVMQAVAAGRRPVTGVRPSPGSFRGSQYRPASRGRAGSLMSTVMKM